MPRQTQLLDVPGLSITEVRCSGGGAGWSSEEAVVGFAVVLVQRGRFRRRVEGVERVADNVAGYVQRPGSTQQIAHPKGGDRCTVLVPSPTILGSILERVGPVEPLFTPPAFDLAHRILVARARDGAERFELTERATLLIGGLVELADRSRMPGGHATVRSRARGLADVTRQAINDDPRVRLDELALLAGVSVYHLSRTFRQVTGITISRYRRRIRVRSAIDRLAAGERDLARLAAELDYADQAHLTRSLRSEIDLTPGRLRAMFAPLAGEVRARA
jgi:AraC-like DNA-binding protein